MSFVYSVSGSGTLRAKGRDPEAVEYEISVYQSGQEPMDVQGELFAPWKVLMEAQRARNAVLVTDKGQELVVLITHVATGEDSALITVNGVPER